MQMWEAKELLEMLEYSDRNLWEATRSVLYLNTLTHSGKGKKPTPKDIIKFAWDKKEEVKNTCLTNDDKDRLQKHAEMIRNKYLNNG